MRPFRKKLLLFCLLIALDLTIATLFIPVSAESPEDLKALWFGWPVAFIVQESAAAYGDDAFPRHLIFSGPWEHPTDLFFSRFLASLFLSFLMVLGAVALIGSVPLPRLPEKK
jgi:hypothetical protein